MLIKNTPLDEDMKTKATTECVVEKASIADQVGILKLKSRKDSVTLIREVRAEFSKKCRDMSYEELMEFVRS